MSRSGWARSWKLRTKAPATAAHLDSHRQMWRGKAARRAAGQLLDIMMLDGLLEGLVLEWVVLDGVVLRL